MRVHINKALKTRCKAIQTALKKYNAAAAALSWPPLDWKHVSTYGSLAEFSLLRECRADIRHQPWAQASNRQAAAYDLKIQGALVEQSRLNMEVCHLATSIHDEEEDLAGIVTATKLTNPFLATELEGLMAHRVCLNNVHRRCIAQIHTLHIFNGDKTFGQRIGRASKAQAVTSDAEMGDDTGSRTNDEVGISTPNDVEMDEDDEVVEELDNIIHFMDSLATGPDE